MTAYEFVEAHLFGNLDSECIRYLLVEAVEDDEELQHLIDYIDAQEEAA
ncbi:hypothetical protein XMV201_003239 [Aliiroseovarius sp. xm-v-201]|nr:hypothetical protein [Aliiroseovarius sp. xm-v-201]NRP51451.1 hypothetical protein [Aliiroseovarius sp. xm-m-354]NRQ06206.1 hypothetical protein [Aliiroseovarius sp. xm-m-309]NRQ09405.1 hypothetical protein [Aliiroseovarius sp. xm-v-201]NRQ12786.1 hypothetical protein [Aliiroseovarius sp. xm-v-208]